MMVTLQVLGSVDIRSADDRTAAAVLTQPKRLALLAYLARGRSGVRHRRDRLASLFWPDLSEEDGRRALRQAIHFLRQHLGVEVITSDGKDEVGLDRSRVTCDAAHFEEHLAAGEEAAALGLYRGDFLAGFHVTGASSELDEWLDEERRTLRRAARAAAGRLADAAAADDRIPEALRWAHWALDLPGAEDADAVRVMTLFERAGDPGGGLAEYHRYARRLADELGAEPGIVVRDVAARLDQREPLVPPAPREDAAPPEPGPPPRVAAALPRGRWRLAVAGTVLSVVALALWRSSAVPLRLGGATPKEVAVATFSNRTGEPRFDLLGSAAAERIARGVLRIPGVDVRTVGAGSAPRTATVLIRGSYYLVPPDSLRYAAEVVERATGRILRVVDPVAATAALPLAGVEELSDRLSSAIAAIADPVPAMPTEPGTMPPRYDAWREYVRGQQAYWSGNLADALPALLRAGTLDSSYTEARVSASAVAVELWECGIVDSLHRLVDGSGERATELERLTTDISMARCRSDWAEALNLHRRRARFLPGSALAKWSLAMAARQAGRPREALGLMEEIDPARDLAWLGAAGRSLFWREVAAASHALGDFRREELVAERSGPPAGTPIAAATLKARSLAGQARFAEAVQAAEGIAALSADPALQSGLAPRGMRPGLLATPGWALYHVAAELAAHGGASEAKGVARQSVAWIRARGAPLAEAREQQVVLGRALLLADEPGEARVVLANLARRDSGSVDVRGLLGVAEALTGNGRAARATIAWLRTLPAPSPAGGPAYYEAAILAALGDTAAGSRALERLPGNAHPYDFLELHADPILAPFRGSAVLSRMIRPQG